MVLNYRKVRDKMQVELKVNDKSVQAEISEEQLKKMGLFEQLKELGLVEDKPKTGYERVEKGSTYFYNYSSDDTDNDIDKKDMVDQEYYNNANYYSDKMIAENNARADRLLRQLRRWQAQNDEVISVEDWNNESKKKWFIIQNTLEIRWFIVIVTIRSIQIFGNFFMSILKNWD